MPEAQLRLADLRSQLNQFRSLAAFPDQDEDHLEMAVQQIAVIQQRIEKRLGDPTARLDPTKANVELAKVADTLHTWIGTFKFGNDGEERK